MKDAEKIARKPLFALKLSKEAVNAAQDAQGRVGAMQTSFVLHQLAHTHNLHVYGACSLTPVASHLRQLRRSGHGEKKRQRSKACHWAPLQLRDWSASRKTPLALR
jgi:hypothetical protein